MEFPRNIIFIIILFLPIAFFITQASPQGVPRIITKEDSGREIAVSTGDAFEIRLEQPGATGFLWQIVEPDKAHLVVLESSQAPLKGNRVAGAPVLKTWKIKALKPGHANLKIVLFRPWEGAGKAADEFSLKINIK